MENNLVSDGTHVVLGQTISAAGTLVGVRLLTEVLEPEVFGSVGLITGVVALTLGVSSGATMQAVLRMFPDCSRKGTLDLLRVTSTSILRTWTLLFAGILSFGCLTYFLATQLNPWLLALVPGLLIIDTARAYQVTLLNAARRQRLMATWLGAETWIRSLLAFAGVKIIGPSAEAVLAGYFVGSWVLWLYLKRAAASHSGPLVSQVPGDPSVERADDLRRLRDELKRYVRPLVPLAIVGWISGQADRYIIGGLLGLASAGQYAAIYGLVSRPFLMLGATIELIYRQVLYEAVSADDLRRSQSVLLEWLAIVGVLSVLGLVGFSFFYSKIALILLAEPYRAGAYLMPWIASGYCLLLLAQVIERVCYATRETGAVLLIQTAGAISSVPISTIGVLRSGLSGAARAVPAYFGLQLALTLTFTYRIARNYLQSAAVAKK